MSARDWTQFSRDFSIMLVVCLCGLARLQYAMGQPWWATLSPY